MMNQESSLDTTDENEGIKCACCHYKKLQTTAVSNLSPELISKIDTAVHYQLTDNDMVCDSCIAKYTLVVISLKSKTEVPLRLHRDECDYCGGSLLLRKKDKEDEDSGDEMIGAPQDVRPRTSGGDESKEYMKHRHLSHNSFVHHDMKGFVAFAIRCYHKVLRRRITLNSCLHDRCRKILMRKYEAAKTGDYYTPRKRRSQAYIRPICTVKSCEEVSVCHSEIIPNLFDSIFDSNRNQNTKVPLCQSHRMQYKNNLEGNKFCLLCHVSLRRSKKSDLSTPTEDSKSVMIRDNEKCGIFNEFPDDFVTSEYTLHRKCMRNFRHKVEEAEKTSETVTDTTSQGAIKRRRILDEPQAGPSGMQGTLPEISIPIEDLEAGPSRPSGQSSPTGDLEAGSSVMQDTLQDIANPMGDLEAGPSRPSGQSSPDREEYQHDETQELEEFLMVVPEITKKLSRTEILDLVDVATIQFIQEQLSKKCFLFRKDVVNYWNDLLKTLGFQHNYTQLEMPTVRPHRVQKRIQDAWQIKYPEEEKELQFTFRSNKKGNI